MSKALLLSNNSNKLSKYNLENIYKKYLSQSNSEYESLIDDDPKKFYTVIKNSKIYEGFTNTSRYKIFEKVCHMIKSINQNEISLGLDILDLIIPYTDISLLENTFTFSSINNTTFGLFLYSLEETKEIKIKTLKLISKYHKEIKAQNNFEYLLELINDEENEVRYEAINCLENLIPSVDILPYRACEIIIFSLKEKNNKLRKLFMNLLSKMKLDIDQDKFENILKLIKENIESFPNDKEKILKFVKNFTKNNIGCLNDDFFIKIFGLEKDFLIMELDGENEDIYYIIKMLVFDTYLISKNYKIGFKIPNYFIKNLYHYQITLPDIFEGKLSEQIQEKLKNLKKENIINNSTIEIYNGIDINKINEIENILINDYKNPIIFEYFYEYIKYFIINKLKFLAKENIYIKIIKKLMIKIRLINIFLNQSTNNENNIDKKFNNSKELIQINELFLNFFDNILINNIADLEKEIKEIQKHDINNLILSLKKESTPHIGISKLEENQIYSNIKRGNKIFPFVMEFNIMIYHIHNLFEYKKSKEKNEIFIRNLFNCYIVSTNDKQIFNIDLFNSNCSVSSSLDKDYISLKYKGAMFLSNFSHPKDGLNEFCFYLEFKDKYKYKNNDIRKLIFNIDI